MKYLFTSRNYLIDGSSIAVTWVWAPAIYVSYEVGAKWGLWGFLMFIVPNVLGLIFFGYVAQRLMEKKDGFAVCDTVEIPSAKKLLAASSFFMLTVSTLVQISGCVLVLKKYFSCPDWQIAVGLSFFVFLYAIVGGLKWCVLTDFAKYVIFVFLGAYLLWNNGISISEQAYASAPVMEPFLAFGLIAIVNLLTAEYCDQTFWQRAWSLNKNRVFKTFLWGALLFAVVPLIFGTLGMTSYGGETNAAKVFTAWHFDAIVLLALIATFDSNVCGTESLAWRLQSQKNFTLPVVISLLSLVVANGLFLFEIPILSLFLAYGILRTSVCGLVLSSVFNNAPKYSVKSSFVFVFLAAPAFIALSILQSDFRYVITLFVVIFSTVAFLLDRRENVHKNNKHRNNHITPVTLF